MIRDGGHLRGRRMFGKRKRRILPALMALVVLIGGVTAFLVTRDPEEEEVSDFRFAAVQACNVPVELLERVARGYYPGRSGDILAIERAPNQYGTRHSSPYPYTQDVPIVLYGPGYIRSGTTPSRPATVADLAPTFAELMGFDAFPKHDGRVLREALLPEDQRRTPPKLIFTIVWDGGGDNALQEWPDRWPNLEDLMKRGVNYENGTVGSSPSITPAVHATIGTGAFPARHGITDITIRLNGVVTDPWKAQGPKAMKVRTLADAWDLANDNKPVVGMVAHESWHAGMIGHGTSLEGADDDVAVLNEINGTEFETLEEYYSLPGYVFGREGLEEDVAELDQRDGEADDRWLGNELVLDSPDIRKTPAWSPFQTRTIEKIIRNEGFGKDGLTDLFYTNYKSLDLAGHQWNIVEPEVRDNLEAHDAQLPDLIALLDEVVGEGRYVVALTADHGMTPYPEVTGGWSIDSGEVLDDVNERFDRNGDKRELMIRDRGYMYFVDRREMRRNDVTARQIAAFIRDYRLKQNVDGAVPAAYESRRDERIYLTSLTPSGLRAALDCATQRARSR